MPLTRRERGGAVVVALLMLAATAAARLHPDPGFRSTPLPDHPTTYPDGHHRFLQTQVDDAALPVGYDPCREVPVVVDFAGAPGGFAGLVEQTVHDVDQASGLRFRYAGATHDRPAPPTVGRVRIRFTTASDRLPSNAAGTGLSIPLPEVNGLSYYRGGDILLSTTLRHYSVHQRLTVLHHEFGHVVGLDHVASGDEIMNPGNYHRATFAHGDLTGLALLGRLPCA